jgi:ABC-type cobalamin transport system permease subunit
MRLLEMGDDSACALGVSVERSRLLLMLVAVVLTAAATALAGPISFIALVAPHIARRLSGTARWGLTQAALCGAAAAAGRSLRPAAVYALSAAGGRGDRQPRRYLPYRLVNSGVPQEMTATSRLRGDS